LTASASTDPYAAGAFATTKADVTAQCTRFPPSVSFPFSFFFSFFFYSFFVFFLLPFCICFRLFYSNPEGACLISLFEFCIAISNSPSRHMCDSFVQSRYCPIHRRVFHSFVVCFDSSYPNRQPRCRADQRAGHQRCDGSLRVGSRRRRDDARCDRLLLSGRINPDSDEPPRCCRSECTLGPVNAYFSVSFARKEEIGETAGDASSVGEFLPSVFLSLLPCHMPQFARLDLLFLAAVFRVLVCGCLNSLFDASQSFSFFLEPSSPFISSYDAVIFCFAFLCAVEDAPLH
jgi:hypothetical protein